MFQEDTTPGHSVALKMSNGVTKEQNMKLMC